jgi:hypothetical protein
MHDTTLPIRITAGVAVFLTLAIVDYVRNGKAATRWREYAFLFACTALAMLYGGLNDQVSSRISWEYFYYGKELGPILGPQTPPDAFALSVEAAKVGMAATWSAGLIIGAALLIANNPRPNRPRLSYRGLFFMIGLVATLAIGLSIVLTLIGYAGGLAWMSSDFQEMQKANLWRPRHFMATYGEHLGGYVGGLLGIVTTCVLIVKKRSRQSRDRSMINPL